MTKIVYDAENAIVGRMGSIVAKELLKGNDVTILNSEKSIVSGNPKIITEKIRRLRRMGRGASLKGPKISKIPERLLKRMLRGMLPWDKPRGRAIYKKLKCYSGIPEGFKDSKNLKKFEHKIPLKYTTIKKISEEL